MHVKKTRRRCDIRTVLMLSQQGAALYQFRYMEGKFCLLFFAEGGHEAAGDTEEEQRQSDSCSSTHVALPQSET